LQHRRPSSPPPQDGTTALHTAAKDGLLDLIDKLLDAGADIDARQELV
jgi:ankyrin repeat protein